MEILENITADFKGFETLQNSLPTIIKAQLHSNLEGFELPSSFATYKSTGGNCLGVVGKDFIPAQPKAILESLIDCNEIDFSKISYHEMKGGAKVRFDIPLETFEFKNKAKVGDATSTKICIQTGFDGLTKTSLFLFTERLICTNGMKNTITEFQASFKNTVGNQGKAVSLCNDVAKASRSIDRLKEVYINLDKLEVNQDLINRYLLAVADLDWKVSKEWSTRKQNIFDAINQSIALEFSRTGASGFGLLNGVTHYTNHIVNATNREDFLFVDGGAKMNDKAMNFLIKELA